MKYPNLFFYGLDNAGKTTIIHLLNKGIFISTTPTLTADIIKIDFQNIKVTAFDMAGHKNYRNSWEEYLSQPLILIFVIDSSDTDRYTEAKYELWHILNNEKVDSETPLLILANKIDLAQSNDINNISIMLELEKIASRKKILIKTSAITKFGLTKAFEWLIETIFEKNCLPNSINNQ